MNFENEIKREFDKDLEIPDIVDNRLQDAYQMIQDDVVQMRANSDERADIHNISRKKKKKAIWFTMTAAACVVFVCTIVFVSNPALAKGIPFIGNIFEQLQEKPNPYGKDKTAYKEIGEHSVKVDAPRNTATDRGITLTVSDAYCDGYDLYIALAITAEGEEYSSADTFNLLFFEEEDPVPFVANIQINEMNDIITSPMQLKKGESDAFIQLLQIPAANLSSSESGTTFPDEMDITLTCNGIGVHMAGDNTVYGSFTSEMLSSKTIEGNWNLAFHVTVDQSNNETIDLQAENNGFLLTKAVKTPSNFHLSIIIPSEWAEKNPALQIFDSEGNRIELMMGSMTTLEDGSLLEEWTGEKTDASEFLVRVIDKNNSTQDNLAILAEIPFSIGK